MTVALHNEYKETDYMKGSRTVIVISKNNDHNKRGWGGSAFNQRNNRGSGGLSPGRSVLRQKPGGCLRPAAEDTSKCTALRTTDLPNSTPPFNSALLSAPTSQGSPSNPPRCGSATSLRGLTSKVFTRIFMYNSEMPKDTPKAEGRRMRPSTSVSQVERIFPASSAPSMARRTLSERVREEVGARQLSLSPGSRAAAPGAEARSPARESQRRRLAALTSAGEKKRGRKNFQNHGNFLPSFSGSSSPRPVNCFSAGGPASAEAAAAHVDLVAAARCWALGRASGLRGAGRARECARERAPPRAGVPLGGDRDNSTG